MVSTRRSPQKKTRPATGVPALSGQARVRAERAEQRNEQRSAAARANAPVEEAQHRPIKEEEVLQVLKPIKCVGLNPYKMVEMFKNYRPVVPVEFHSDELYAEPSLEVWSKVKVEKTDRSEFRANLKAKKYAGKERVESTVFDSDEGNDGEEGKA
jgi:hypothetical protein